MSGRSWYSHGKLTLVCESDSCPYSITQVSHSETHDQSHPAHPYTCMAKLAFEDTVSFSISLLQNKETKTT